MLSILRRNAGSWAIKIILSFIALTFIWWGVGTYSERDRNVAATVGGETITMNELSGAVANLEKSYREVYGAAFTPEMAKTLDLKKQAMDSLVQRKILLAEAAKMGLSATDEEVQREIAAVPAFQQGGQFRDELYRSVLSYNRVTPAEFEATRRVEITMKKVKDLVAAGALVPETEAKELFRVSSRKVRLLVVSADPGKGKADAPTEGEILAKYEQGKERFRTPARVKLVVAAFTPDHFGREVTPSEAEIKAFHETNSDRFRTEERRLVSRIVLPFGKKDRDAVRKKAEETLVKASKGKAEFDALAKASARGKNGEAWISRKDAGTALSEPLFQAAVDTVVGPIELPGSFVLARVNRIRFPEALPLSQVRDLVIEQIRREKGKDLAVVKAYEALPKATAGKSVKATAAAVRGTGRGDRVGGGGRGARPPRGAGPGRAAASIGRGGPREDRGGRPLPLPGDGEGGLPRPPPVGGARQGRRGGRPREKGGGGANGAGAGPRGLEHGGGTRGEREERGAFFLPHRLVRPPLGTAPRGARRGRRPSESPLRPLHDGAGLPEGVPGTGRESPRRSVFRRAASLRHGVGDKEGRPPGGGGAAEAERDPRGLPFGPHQEREGGDSPRSVEVAGR